MVMFSGEPDEIRTHDSRLKRAVLYRLSYWLILCDLSQTVNFTINARPWSSKKANGFIVNPQTPSAKAGKYRNLLWRRTISQINTDSIILYQTVWVKINGLDLR
jgi:hypothetical protein